MADLKLLISFTVTCPVRLSIVLFWANTPVLSNMPAKNVTVPTAFNLKPLILPKVVEAGSEVRCITRLDRIKGAAKIITRYGQTKRYKGKPRGKPPIESLARGSVLRY